jgi:hypothetical protein
MLGIPFAFTFAEEDEVARPKDRHEIHEEFSKTILLIHRMSFGGKPVMFS